MSNIKTALYEFTTAPSGEVVSLDIVKANANIDFDTQDDLIQFYIDIAVDRISQLTNRLLQPAVLNGFYSYPDGTRYEYGPFLWVEKVPITAINEVAIWDGTIYAPLASTEWTEEKTSTYSRILLGTTTIFNNNTGATTPIAYPIRVGFDAGYPSATAIPPSLVGAVMQYATWLYSTRGDCSGCEGLKNVGGFMFPGSIADLVSSFIVRRAFG